MRTMVLAMGLLLGSGHFGQAFHYSDTIADWLCAGEGERAAIVSTLSLTVGQGWDDRDEKFFAGCIAEVASDSRAHGRRLGDIAAGCMLMAQVVLPEND